MLRRKFLRGLFGAALVPVVGMAKPRERDLYRQIRDCDAMMQNPTGFGLALVKPEGKTVDLDDIRPGHIIHVSGPPRDAIMAIPACDCADGPHGTACSNRNVLKYG